MAGEAVRVSPTIIARACAETVGFVTVGEGTDRALLVFRGPEDAAGFRRTSGDYGPREGFVLVGIGREGLRQLPDAHELQNVAMPEAWTGAGRVDLFDAGDFLEILEGADQPA